MESVQIESISIFHVSFGCAETISIINMVYRSPPSKSDYFDLDIIFMIIIIIIIIVSYYDGELCFRVVNQFNR